MCHSNHEIEHEQSQHGAGSPVKETGIVPQPPPGDLTTLGD